MQDFKNVFQGTFNTQREQWEKALRSELKIDEITGKVSKNHHDLGAWPTLSTTSTHMVQLHPVTEWKKASQTYIRPDINQLKDNLIEDFKSGVRTFFLHKEYLSNTTFDQFLKALEALPNAKDIEVFLLGPKNLDYQSSLAIVDENHLIHARVIHDEGGHNVHELALLACRFIDSLDKPVSHLGVFVDSHFFKNIAKVRALKLIVSKILQEAGTQKSIKIVTLNSYREWTLYERYSNMLRNAIQVASGYIAGADVIQSSGYQSIFELESNIKDSEHEDRSLRMARNTCHILNLESMLGLVDDASFGSYHLESLTQQYAEKSWKLMQDLLKIEEKNRIHYLKEELSKVRNARLERVERRKDVLAGTNDYPNAEEQLNISLKQPSFFRVARVFEELRLSVEMLKSKPKVHIVLEGEYSLLINRINFIKNYFELIGLEVIDPLYPQKRSAQDILVLCAPDEAYANLAGRVREEEFKPLAQFIAGKVELENFESIFVGQNVYQVLFKLVQKIKRAQ